MTRIRQLRYLIAAVREMQTRAERVAAGLPPEPEPQYQIGGSIGTSVDRCRGPGHHRRARGSEINGVRS